MRAVRSDRAGRSLGRRHPGDREEAEERPRKAWSGLRGGSDIAVQLYDASTAMRIDDTCGACQFAGNI